MTLEFLGYVFMYVISIFPLRMFFASCRLLWDYDTIAGTTVNNFATAEHTSLKHTLASVTTVL